MYWDHNDVQSNTLMNGEIVNDPHSYNSILMVYALDFSCKIVKLVDEPILRQELLPDHTPIECILLPLQVKSKSNIHEVRGQEALVCKNKAMRLLKLSTLKSIRVKSVKSIIIQTIGIDAPH